MSDEFVAFVVVILFIASAMLLLRQRARFTVSPNFDPLIRP